MIRTVLFDLDGTILDTNELIFRSFEYVWEQIGLSGMTREQLTPYMGGKLDEMFREVAGADEQQVEQYIRLYREFNWAHHDELVRPFPYVEEVMAKLQEAGIRMGVVTTKIRKTSEMGLELCRLSAFVETIVSLDDVTHAKPHPEPVLQALSNMGVEASETIMIGDSKGDIVAAREAGVRSVAVGWSIKSREELDVYKPDYWINDMRELLDLVGVARSV